MTDQTATTTSLKRSDKLDSLVLLRGIAVMMVCFGHFAQPLQNGHVLSDVFRAFSLYGKNGVVVFFVISGFVIPLSLYKGGYKITDYGRFLYKRFLRLHPPYLAALVLTYLIMFLSYRYRHLAFPETVSSILKSIVYLYRPDDNPVFWTLKVEAEFYLFIGLFYLLLMKQYNISYFLIVPVLLLCSLTPLNRQIVLIKYIAFFFMGNYGYLLYTKQGNKVLNAIMIAILVIYTFFFYNITIFISVLFTIACFILFLNKSISAIPKFLGVISYSIYLIHFPIGTKFINLIGPRVSLAYGWLIFLITLVISLVLSWIFYRLFEVFSENFSRKIKYKHAGTASY